MEKRTIEQSINKFCNWLDRYGDFSYDRMDYWSSKVGIFAKKIYYRNKILGSPLAFLGLIFENFTPSLQKMFANKRREAIGDAHYAMAFMNLYQINNDNKYLVRAEKYLVELKESRCKGYQNFCWGYTFGWETGMGFLKSGIPFITVTPYAFWAFKKHYELTKNIESKEICRSIAEFALHDLNKIRINDSIIATSYSPNDRNPIINANSYRAALLIGAYDMFNEKKYLSEALENIELVKYFQGSRGEWYYEANFKKDSFIDNFHTCFILRNLLICYNVLREQSIAEVVLKGYNYYKEHLLNNELLPRHFSVSKYFKFRKYEMYDFAEGIRLGLMMKDFDNDALKIVNVLTNKMIRYQLNDGHFITRITSFGTKHKVPYHRWPQSQIFYSLTYLLKNHYN